MATNVEESEGDGENGAKPEQRVTGGRRLRRVAARKTVAESDGEDQDYGNNGKAIDNEGDDEEFDGTQNEGKRKVLKRKKSAKKGTKEVQKRKALK